MNAQEQEEARQHWREQVEDILAAVRDALGEGPGLADTGRAVISFIDSGEDQVEVSAAFVPEPRELPSGEVEATPAQFLALSALESLAEIDDEHDHDH
jgi:hypothetical protein